MTQPQKIVTISCGVSGGYSILLVRSILDTCRLGKTAKASGKNIRLNITLKQIATKLMPLDQR